MKLSLESVFGLVIGLIFVVIIGFVIVTLIKSQLPRDIDDATLSSFEEVVNTIKRIEAEEIVSKKLLVDTNEPFAIVGFSKDAGEVVNGKITMTIFKYFPLVSYPLKNPCTKACLCICTYEGSGREYALKDDDCSKYKKRCVEFDDVHTLKYVGGEYKSEILFIRSGDYPLDLLVEGKNGVIDVTWEY